MIQKRSVKDIVFVFGGVYVESSADSDQQLEVRVKVKYSEKSKIKNCENSKEERVKERVVENVEAEIVKVNKITEIKGGMVKIEFEWDKPFYNSTTKNEVYALGLIFEEYGSSIAMAIYQEKKDSWRFIIEEK